MMACTRRNQIECEGCGDVIDGDGDQLTRTVRWGFWDAEAQNYDGRSHLEHYCQECWHEEFKRDAAAHYEITDGQQFWDILEAADGSLVADLRPIFIGGRPWIRVVDGDLQGMHATREVDQRGDQIAITHGVEVSDVDRDWFDEQFCRDRDGDRPQIALLKPVDETPFADFVALPDDQQTLEEVDR